MWVAKLGHHVSTVYVVVCPRSDTNIDFNVIPFYFRHMNQYRSVIGDTSSKKYLEISPPSWVWERKVYTVVFLRSMLFFRNCLMFPQYNILSVSLESDDVNVFAAGAFGCCHNDPSRDKIVWHDVDPGFLCLLCISVFVSSNSGQVCAHW